MQFTYEAYEQLISRLLDKGYRIKDYETWEAAEQTVILRHDVDYSLERAARFSKYEKELFGGGATYFVLLSTDFYNVHSKTSRQYMEEILKNGGRIGLHFDAVQYPIDSESDMITYVQQEAAVLSDILGVGVNAVSMHRGSQKILASDVKFPGLINSYGELFFKKMKYVSDSRRFWRENVEEIIDSGQYPRLHILTHPFWYMEKTEKTLKQTLQEAVLHASLEYYDHLNDNFRDLDAELGRKEIEDSLGLLRKC
jgi:hypothetical protein